MTVAYECMSISPRELGIIARDRDKTIESPELFLVSTLLVPTLCVGTGYPDVLRHSKCRRAARYCVPTQSVGTRKSTYRKSQSPCSCFLARGRLAQACFPSRMSQQLTSTFRNPNSELNRAQSKEGWLAENRVVHGPCSTDTRPGRSAGGLGRSCTRGPHSNRLSLVRRRRDHRKTPFHAHQADLAAICPRGELFW